MPKAEFIHKNLSEELVKVPEALSSFNVLQRPNSKSISHVCPTNSSLEALSPLCERSVTQHLFAGRIIGIRIRKLRIK